MIICSHKKDIKKCLTCVKYGCARTFGCLFCNNRLCCGNIFNCGMCGMLLCIYCVNRKCSGCGDNICDLCQMYTCTISSIKIKHKSHIYCTRCIIRSRGNQTQFICSDCGIDSLKTCTRCHTLANDVCDTCLKLACIAHSKKYIRCEAILCNSCYESHMYCVPAIISKALASLPRIIIDDVSDIYDASFKK